MKKQYNLLNKSLALNLIFVAIAFSFAIFLIYNETGKFIQKESDSFFQYFSNKFKSRVEKCPIERLRHFCDVERDIKIHNTIKCDTSIYSEKYEKHIMYKKYVLWHKADSGRIYKATFLKEIKKYKDFYDYILIILIEVFVSLFIIVIIFNRFLSGYLFMPFVKILNIMKSYTVGKKIKLREFKSTTKEFCTLKDLFEQMINRTEHDYKTLKEYTENMSHEMQTPLAIIRNKIEKLMSNDALMKENSEAVKNIYQQTNFLSKLASSLNLLTKIENKEFINNAEIKTFSIIKSQIESVKELAELKDLKFNLQLNKNHTFNIDPYLLDIILKNLISNTLKYSTKGSIIDIITTEDKFTISNYSTEQNLNSIKIFDRFYKANSNDNSLGLGLALVKKICDINNINISFLKNVKNSFILEQKQN